MKYLRKKYKSRRKSNYRRKGRTIKPIKRSRNRNARRKSRKRIKRKSKKYGGLRAMDVVNSTLYSSRLNDVLNGHASSEGSTTFQYINRGQ